MYKPIHLESSIVGFHNPYKHKGLSSSEFLILYVRRQSKLAWNKNSVQRAELVVRVLKDWDTWIERVKELFPNTLS